MTYAIKHRSSIFVREVSDMELQLQHLSKQYGTKRAVDNINVSLVPGVYGLLGANGAGKSTLMRMICGILKATSGEIRLNGKTMQELGEQYYTVNFLIFSHSKSHYSL